MTQNEFPEHIRSLIDSLKDQGYLREPVIAGKLFAALRNLIYTYPNMRLGQAIVNAVGDTDLFNIYDEELIQKIEDFVGRAGGNQES